MTGFFRAALVVLLASGFAQNARAGREVTIAFDELPEGAGCPSAAVLGRALEARLPGITADAPRAPERERLRLQLDDAGAAGVRFALVDLTGQTVLERSLAAPGVGARDRAGACGVLAETIALVIERYLRQLGYRAPDPALPRPEPPTIAAGAPPVEAAIGEAARPGGRLTLAAGVSVAPGGGGPTRVEPELAADLLLLPVLFSLRAAVSLPIEVAVPSTDRGVFRHTALPLRAGLGLPVWLPRGGGGWVAVIALGGVDIYRGETRDIAVPQRVQGGAMVAELGLLAELRLGGRLALRPQAVLALRQERAFQVQDPGPGAGPLYVDPRVSLRLGLDLAFALGKN